MPRTIRHENTTRDAIVRFGPLTLLGTLAFVNWSHVYTNPLITLANYLSTDLAAILYSQYRCFYLATYSRTSALIDFAQFWALFSVQIKSICPSLPIGMLNTSTQVTSSIESYTIGWLNDLLVCDTSMAGSCFHSLFALFWLFLLSPSGSSTVSRLPWITSVVYNLPF